MNTNLNTGKTAITTMTVAAILSLSLVVNLPGLAITPMLSTLATVFPGTTQIEKQLLTVLPNLLIIPFVLLSGKLSLTKHRIATIVWALVIFVASSVAYLFAKSMVALIIISCALGCGAGLLIPFAAGLVADTFAGKERMKMMGIKSGISNLSLVVATFAVGWLSTGNWHLPFVVYLVSVIPLALSFWLKNIPANGGGVASHPDPAPQQPLSPSEARKQLPKSGRLWNGIYISRLGEIVGVYAFITFATMAISYYCPFLVQKEHLPDSVSGTITSLLFLFVFLPGFGLAKIVKIFKGVSFLFAALLMLLGLALFAFFPNPVCMCIGASLAGLGYGISQPIIYNKASNVVADPRKATLSLAIVLSANYISITITPFVVDAFRSVLHAQHVNAFPFLLSSAALLAYFIIAVIRRNSYAFNVGQSYYK